MTKLRKVLDTIVSLIRYPHIIKKIKCSKTSIFFVFPSWQIGGSQRVHIDILKAMKEQSPVCFITETQEKEGFKKDFKKVSNLIYLRRWGQKKSFKSIMFKKIAEAVNKKPDAVVFGSNNFFIYDLIPYLASHVRIIDLTHSFSIDLGGYERYSLNRVSRIDHRVVLGKNALIIFEKIYAAHNVPLSLMKRFKIIHNKINSPKNLHIKPDVESLQIIFVSRNSEEKRPDLFFKIVDACIKSALNVSFTVIGDFEKDFSQYSDKVSFKGEISDKDTMNSHYQHAHLILITSTFEGFPMVLLESMAYGVVPISTDVGEIPAYISEEKQIGFLVNNTLSDSQKIQKFTEIISQLSISREQLQPFSTNSYQLVKDNFSEERFNNAYISMLNSQ